MSVIVLLIIAGGMVAAGFLGAFVWAVRSGQFDDTCTPAIRVLLDDRGSPSADRSARVSSAASNNESRAANREPRQRRVW